MKEVNKAIWALLAVIFAIGAVSCSDCNDDPIQPSANWQDELFTSYVEIYPSPMSGLNYNQLGVFVSIENSKGEDLLNPRSSNNVHGGDFYFDFSGEKYFLSDTIGNLPEGMLKWNHTVKIEKFPYAGKYYRNVYYFVPFSVLPYQSDGVRQLTSPVDVSFDFVWPEKGIRKNLRMYCEYNTNFEEDKENAIPDSTGVKYAPFFKTGIWVDGKSTDGSREIKIVVD